MRTKLWITFGLLLVSPAVAEDDPRLRGLTPAQRAQATDPNNPQVIPPEIWRAAPADATVYVAPQIPSETEKTDALRRAMAPIPRVVRLVPAEEKNALDEQADLNMGDLRKFSRRFVAKTDVCARHGLHKVVTHGGRSWRCR
jgi:hypothetical protein